MAILSVKRSAKTNISQVAYFLHQHIMIAKVSVKELFTKFLYKCYNVFLRTGHWAGLWWNVSWSRGLEQGSFSIAAEDCRPGYLTGY